MITGPSGSGKTWTAHDIAEVLSPGGRRVHIDSEPSDDQNTAAELYADHFTFDLIDWRDGPYDPRDLALTIRELGQSPERPDVVIVDSLSPFWRGEGGTLDIAGGAFGGWRAATPAQEDLVAAILAAPFHVILCVRAKQDYAVEQDANGKQTVRKLGLAPVQRDDLEYEVQVSAVIDVDHRIDIGKTRCADLAGKSFHAGHQRELATIYKAWLARGTTVLRLDDVVLIGQAFDSLPDGTRHSAKRQFVAEIGRPEQLEVEQLDAAWAVGARTFYCEFENPKHYREAVQTFRKLQSAESAPVENQKSKILNPHGSRSLPHQIPQVDERLARWQRQARQHARLR
jgi:energy-coupling factor transporter ATP-binding protein EcfA2